MFLNLKKTKFTIAIIYLLNAVNLGVSKESILTDSIVKKSEKIFEVKVTQSSLLEEFYKYHQKYIKNICKKGTEQTFLELMKQYKGQGFFIPTTEVEKIELSTVKEGLQIISQKITWQNEMEKYLINLKNFSSVYILLNELEISLKSSLKLKEKYFDLENVAEKLLIEKSATDEMNKLRILFDRLIIEIPFLEGINFPIDHLKLRSDYEKAKNLKGAKNREKSNKIYFYRKVIEDGASEADMKKNDMYFRALLSSLYLRFRIDNKFISEDLRYDLVDALKGAKYWMDFGKEKILKRHRLWKKRTEEQFIFYKTILENKGKLIDRFGKPLDVAKALSTSRYNLRKFVNEKQIQTYHFWEELPEIYQALFALESILINEAGGIDGREALERKDILSVVLNRLKIPEYNQFSVKDDFYKSYKKQFNKIPNSLWLNMMLKEGEFSFTHFFIHSSLYSFCPDVSPIAKYLRRENLRLAIAALTHPDTRPSITRYFSRSSMIGRIDMGKIWKDEGYYPEFNEIGPEATSQKLLWKNYKTGHYNYWYHLVSKNKEAGHIKILEIKGRIYALNLSSKKFFIYRNPQQFLFFKKERI